MADALSDEAWARICAAAEHTPDAGTRERLSAILFEEYPVFHYDRERVAAALRRSEQMLIHLGAFAEFYRQAWLPHLLEDEVDAIFAGRASAFVVDDKAIEQDCCSSAKRQRDKAIERDCWSIAMLRQRAEAAWLTARAIRRAHRGHRNVQREWLCNQLCTVWLWDFHAPDLTCSVPSWGGAPYGPLIEFLRAAIREVVAEEELPSPYALRDAIRREGAERENARQFGLRFPKCPMPA
jgi:hypothetical protein